MERCRIDLKTFFGLAIPNKYNPTVRYMSGFGAISLGQIPLTFMIPICDLIYRNRSKSHIGSYEIIDFKDFNTL